MTATRAALLALVLAVLRPVAGNTAAAMMAQAPGPGHQLETVLIRDDRLEHRRLALVTRDWFYCYPPTGEVIRVPEGYVTDYASVPEIGWWLISPFGDQAEASGATVISHQGELIAAGAILQIQGGSTGGGRLAAARQLSTFGLGIKVSQDGGITGYRPGSQVADFRIM